MPVDSRGTLRKRDSEQQIRVTCADGRCAALSVGLRTQCGHFLDAPRQPADGAMHSPSVYGSNHSNACASCCRHRLSSLSYGGPCRHFARTQLNRTADWTAALGIGRSDGSQGRPGPETLGHRARWRKDSPQRSPIAWRNWMAAYAAAGRVSFRVFISKGVARMSPFCRERRTRRVTDAANAPCPKALRCLHAQC